MAGQLEPSASATGAGADFPDLVYSPWLDELFPCRVVATSGTEALIMTPLTPRRLRVPRRLIFTPVELAQAVGPSDGARDGGQDGEKQV